MPDYTPPIPQYGVIAKCEVAEEHYGTLLLIPSMDYFYENVKGITAETDKENYWTIYHALQHGLIVRLFPIREETREQWEPAFPLMCQDVWEFVGPHSTPEIAHTLAKSWMKFVDENCKQTSGTRLLIRSSELARMPEPEITWCGYSIPEPRPFPKPE
jgi:hypothetical protein